MDYTAGDDRNAVKCSFVCPCGCVYGVCVCGTAIRKYTRVADVGAGGSVVAGQGSVAGAIASVT